MLPHFSLVRLLLGGSLACLLLGLAPTLAAADPYEDVQKAIFEANKAFQENRRDETLKQLSQAVELIRDFKPDDKDYIREAIYRSNIKEPEAALKALDAALAINPNAAEAYYLRGHVYGKLMKVTKQTDEMALKSLKTALELKAKYTNPVNKYWAIDAVYALGNFLITDLRDYEQAVFEFQKLVDREPDNAKYLYFLGLAQTRRKSYDEAAEVFSKALEHSPDDWQIHLDYIFPAGKSAAGTKGAIKRYEALLNKHPEEVAVLMGLAKLYVEVGQKERAVPLLHKVRNHHALLDLKSDKGVLLRSISIDLAKVFAAAGEYEQAARQFGRVLAALPSSWAPENKIDLTIEYGKALVRGGQEEEGIQQLNQALMLQRYYLPGKQDPLDILFELGSAHWKLAKKNKGRRSDEAEIYFRKYLSELKTGTAGTQRFAKDVEIAESLGDLYLEVQEYKKAAEVFREATTLIDINAEKEKCPTSRVQIKYIQALHGQGNWDHCILIAKDFVTDKEYGPKARQMLAHAYIENSQAAKAIDHLNALRTTAEWTDESLLYMGRALLEMNRLDDALKYLEEAYQKHSMEEKYASEYARVLYLKNRPIEARKLYETFPHSPKAKLGLGDLETQLAEGTAGADRLNHFTKAVKYYEEARDMGLKAEALDRLGPAEREKARAEADLQASSDRLRVIFYTVGLILAALIPIGVMVYLYRRQWAMRCFQEVCDLERDLIKLIRERVQSRWNGEWKRLTEEPFRGRIDFKSLRSRAEREGAKDILAVANFGHLVGIIDAGWEALGFSELCAQDVVDPKEVILANLSYVGSCRVCLAHVGKLQEMTGRQRQGDPAASESLKSQISKHLHRQVKTSLRIIRAKFDVTPIVKELPMLAPVAPGTAIRK